jgi:hypothetical protein
MNKLLTEDLIRQIRLMNYDRSKSLDEQNYFDNEIIVEEKLYNNNFLVENTLILEGDWDSESGDDRYWVALFNRIKSAGFNVNYYSEDGLVNDPKISTYISWGDWVIYKDLSVDNGYPIQYNGGLDTWYFKFQTLKYKGEELDKCKIILNEPRLITTLLSVIKLKDLDTEYNKIQSFCNYVILSRLGLNQDKKFDVDLDKFESCNVKTDPKTPMVRVIYTNKPQETLYLMKNSKEVNNIKNSDPDSWQEDPITGTLIVGQVVETSDTNEGNWGLYEQNWVKLFMELKRIGINPKYGANGVKVNDPNLAEFIYWGKWLIWKDIRKNNGYPISYENWKFRFENNKYLGERIEDCTVISNNDIYTELSRLVKLKTLNRKTLSGVSEWENMKDQTDEARMARYRTINEVKKTMDDLVYDIDLGNDNEVYKLLKNEDTYQIKNGFEMYLKAKENAENLKSFYLWSRPSSFKITAEDMSSGKVADKINDISLSTAIDPSYFEGILWVDAKAKYFANKVAERKLSLSLEDSWENSWRFRNAMNPRKSDETKLSTWFSYLKTSPLNNISNTKIKSPNMVDSYGKKVVIDDKGREEYLTSLKNFLDKEIKRGVAAALNMDEQQYNDLMYNKEYGYEANLKNLKQQSDSFYEHNKLIVDLKKEWITQKKSVCDVPLKKVIKTYDQNRDYDELMDLGRKLKTAMDNGTFPKPPQSAVWKMADRKSWAIYSLKDICNNKTNQGLFIFKSEDKERIKEITGFDWSKFSFEYTTEKRPDNLFCMCANPKIIDYKTVRIKVPVYVEFMSFNESNKMQDYGETTAKREKLNIGETVIEVDPKQYMQSSKDVRGLQSKLYDWGKKCFTAANDEGEVGSDFHCILDIASVVAVFIPVVGPIISMVIDVANGMYYLVDALKADSTMERNSALISAGFSILGGLASGLGDLRALVKVKPNGTKILAMADEFVAESKILSLASKKEAEKMSKEILYRLASKYNVTLKELELVEQYLKSLSKLKGLSKSMTIYKQSIRNIQGKIGFRRWGELMSNKNFRKIVVEANGNVIDALKIFSKNAKYKDFLIQLGFFVGGESILPGLLNPAMSYMVKSGKWGTVKQQIQANGYDFDQVANEFKIDENKIDFDMSLLEKAWNEKCIGDWKTKCVKIKGTGKPWRPGWSVPLSYQTEKYKKSIKEDQDKVFKDNQDLIDTYTYVKKGNRMYSVIQGVANYSDDGGETWVTEENPKEIKNIKTMYNTYTKYIRFMDTNQKLVEIPRKNLTVDQVNLLIKYDKSLSRKFIKKQKETFDLNINKNSGDAVINNETKLKDLEDI